MKYTVNLLENFRCGIGYLECTIPGAEQALRCVVTISYWRLFCKRIKIGEEILSERFEYMMYKKGKK